MKIDSLHVLTDENISPKVVKCLRDQGLDVLDVKEERWYGEAPLAKNYRPGVGQDHPGDQYGRTPEDVPIGPRHLRLFPRQDEKGAAGTHRGAHRRERL